MSKSDMYTFDKKVQFYQQRHQHESNCKIVISLTVDFKAQEIAKNLGIEVYSSARDVEVS
jgi:rRNA maturation endonuclease Nob1